jgi:hypothetical protein
MGKLSPQRNTNAKYFTTETQSTKRVTEKTKCEIAFSVSLRDLSVSVVLIEIVFVSKLVRYLVSLPNAYNAVAVRRYNLPSATAGVALMRSPNVPRWSSSNLSPTRTVLTTPSSEAM